MKSRIVVVMLLAFFCCTQSNAQSFLENLGKTIKKEIKTEVGKQINKGINDLKENLKDKAQEQQKQEQQKQEKMDLDIQVSKLKLLKANHTSQRYRLEDNIAQHYPKQIATMKERLAGYKADIQTYGQNKPLDKDSFSIKIGNRVFTDKKEAGTVLIDMCRNAKQPNMAVSIGEFQGFKMRRHCVLSQRLHLMKWRSYCVIIPT